MRKLRLLAASLTLLCGGPALAATEPVPLRALLPGDLAEPAPGCALAVYRDGRLDSLTSDGYANLERKTPIDGDTVFYAASISKQFTALAVVQLALQNKLDLDGDLRQWIPELPQYAVPVTPRMLLQHRSGILDSLSLVRLSKKPGAAGSTSRADTLALVLAQTQTNFKPGTETYYSNGAYLLAAELIQRVSGQSYAQYLQQHILDPIGMRSSYMLDGEPKASPHRAHGYAKLGDGYQIRDTFPRYGGSGGLMVSLNDLARYEYDIEHGHKVWTPQVRKLMETPGQLTDGKPATTMDRPGGMVYALGLMVGERNGRHLVEHGGGADAFRHMYSRVPAQKLAVATFCNHGNSQAVEKTHAAISLLLGPSQSELAQRPATGVYRAQTLPARYLLSRNGVDKLTLAILPDGQDQASEILSLSRDDKDPVFRNGDLQVEASSEQADTILIGSPRARGLRAVRQGH